EGFAEAGQRGYRFKGNGTYGRLLAGIASVTSGGDPGGIRTRDLDLERVASWARLDDGVTERQYTRPRAALSDSGGAARSSRPSIAPPGDWPRRSPATRAPAARAPRRATRPR